MKVTKTNKQFVPFTNIYLIKNGEILLMHREPKKKIWPDKILGIGGKVEPGEDIFKAAEREFFEETGAKPIGLKLKGTFSWEDDTNYSGINFIFVASDYEGEINFHSDEGEIGWYKQEGILENRKLAEHQKLYLELIFSDSFYVSHSHFMGHFNTGDIVKYDDNIEYFRGRSSEK